MASPLNDSLATIFPDDDSNFDDVFAHRAERHAARLRRQQFSELEQQQVCQGMLKQTELICPKVLTAKPRSMQAFKLVNEVFGLSSLAIFFFVQVSRRVLLNVGHKIHLLVASIEMIKDSNDAPVTAPLLAAHAGTVKQLTIASDFTSGHAG